MAIPKLQVYALPESYDIPRNKVDRAFKPQRAAPSIHDMQDYFVSLWGENCPTMEQVIVNTATLRDYCKQHNTSVYYTTQPKEWSDEDQAPLDGTWGPSLTRSPEQQKVVDRPTPDADDAVLMRWRYGVFHRSPLEQMLKESGCNWLIIIGVYAHIGCMITVTNAFMHDTKPLMVADALADFSRDRHLMPLKYVTGWSGQVVITERLLLASVLASKVTLREIILPLPDEPDEPLGDDNLIDYGPDSVHMIALAACWRKVHGDIDFVMLAKNLTIDTWWKSLSREVK